MKIIAMQWNNEKIIELLQRCNNGYCANALWSFKNHSFLSTWIWENETQLDRERSREEDKSLMLEQLHFLTFMSTSILLFVFSSFKMYLLSDISACTHFLIGLRAWVPTWIVLFSPLYFLGNFLKLVSIHWAKHYI